MQSLMLRAIAVCVAVTSAGMPGISQALEKTDAKPWRSGWLLLPEDDDDEAMISGAKELDFQALIIGGTPERVQAFSTRAMEDGIETYSVIVPRIPEGGQKSRFEQRMPRSDEELLEKLKANPEEWKKTYQTGGEPAEGHAEVFRKPFVCFHHKEVMEATKAEIRNMLERAPALAGIGFDAFGYQNYKNCVCEESLRQLEAYRKENPAMTPEESESAFALDSMVGCINELADYARSLKPDVKTTIHIWPTYLPEPLYGNRLNLTYCCQTVAWFFPPYWSESKIAEYTKQTVEGANKHFPAARGIPFLGIYLGRKSSVDKPLEQFQRELQTIFANEPTPSISIHEIADVIRNPEYREAFQEAVRKSGRASVP